MMERVAAFERRYEELNELMIKPEVVTDLAALQGYAREQAGLEPLVTKYRAYRTVSRELEDTLAMVDGGFEDEMVELAKEESERLRLRQEQLAKEIRLALIPKDPHAEKEVIVEIRAGTGGEEAALFAGDLFRMYSRYAERHRWTIDVVDFHDTGIGGIKEVVFEIHGRGAYSRLKYESGVHRVQRVPVTEASGRIHTSTATVAVLPAIEEVEVDINQDDLRIDTYCSGGAGGQNVNKVNTAVRITHLPSGLVVTCQDERSQLKNKTKAMAVLRARLYDIEQRKQTQQIEQARRSQVGSAERSEKIRTFNFPQDRVTDHRIGLTLHSLERILDGEIDHLIDSLISEDQARKLESSSIAA